MKIMIVDDHIGMRKMLRSLVSTPDSEIRECEDGPKAVALYEVFQPDLVLMDVLLGNSDGLAATRQITFAHPEARIMILTEHESARLEKTAAEAGACAFLSKDRLLELPRLVAELGTSRMELEAQGPDVARGSIG
jgi:DNA-binding NarL/FixJ family response regulator